jgi:cellobiose-specific phosphotransferase system component IIA
MINKYLAICLIVIVAIVPMSTINYNQFVKAQTTDNLGLGAAEMHLSEAIKALKAGNTEEALMHTEEAIGTLSEGNATMHVDEAIKALKAGNTEEALMHLGEALKAL